MAFLGLFSFKELVTVFSPIENLKSLLKIDIYRLNQAEYIYIYRLSIFGRKFNSALDWINRFLVDKHQELIALCTG